jgi:Flp pilus assembly protein TadG
MFHHAFLAGVSGRRCGRRRRRAWGGALIETAICLPLLLMLSFGAAEYGDFFFVKNALVGAARNGARAAITSTATEANAKAAVTSSLTAANIPSASCTVTTSPTDISTAAAGSSVTVTVTATWGTIGVSPLPASMGGISSTKQVIGSVVMIKE